MPKASTAKTKTASRTAKKTTAKASPKSKPASKKAPAKKASTKKTKPAGEQEVTLDRRGAKAERRGAEQAAAPAADLKPRKKVNRRRQIDPTTCERDYTGAEVEFMNAMDEYKRTSGRMFPTCSEVLEVIRSLGYVQLSAAELAAREPEPEPESVDAAANDAMTDDGEAFDPSEEEHEDADGLLV